MFRRLFWAALAALAWVVLYPAGRVAAQSPRPAVKGAPATTLDRRDFPFLPLREAWSLDLGVAPSVAPTVGPAGTYLAFVNGNIGLFNLTNGRPTWSASLRATHPLVLDDTRLLVTSDRAVDAVRAVDGEPLWRALLPAGAAHAPVARSGWAIVALDDSRIHALRTDAGAAVWTIPLEGVAAIRPVIEGDRLYVGAKGGALHARSIADGAGVWAVRLDGDVTALAAVEGYVFAATANRWLYALDARKGQERWRYRIGGTAIGLAVDDDRVVAVMLDQSVRAFKIGSGAQAWRAPLSFRPAAGPVVAGGSILVTGYAPTVSILDRRTGSSQGPYAVPLPGGPAGAMLETLAAGPLLVIGPTLFDDQVVLLTRQGWLHGARRAFEPPATPLTALPGTPVTVPEPPPGWKPPDQPPAAPDAASPPPAAKPPSPPASDTAGARRPVHRRVRRQCRQLDERQHQAAHHPHRGLQRQHRHTRHGHERDEAEGGGRDQRDHEGERREDQGRDADARDHEGVPPHERAGAADRGHRAGVLDDDRQLGEAIDELGPDRDRQRNHRDRDDGRRDPPRRGDRHEAAIRLHHGGGIAERDGALEDREGDGETDEPRPEAGAAVHEAGARPGPGGGRGRRRAAGRRPGCARRFPRPRSR